jgi:hypothetical protein
MNAAPGQPRPDDDLHVAEPPEPPGTEPPVTGPSLLAAAAAGLVAAITVPDNPRDSASPWPPSSRSASCSLCVPPGAGRCRGRVPSWGASLR